MKTKPFPQGLLKTLIIQAVFVLQASPLISADLAASKGLEVGEITGVGVTEPNLEGLRVLLGAAVHEEPMGDHASANKLVDASLIRLDTFYLLNLSLREDRVILRTRDVKLTGMDELDIGVKRTLAALLENSDFESTASRGLITKTEERNPAKIKSVSGFELSMGGMTPVTAAFGNYKPMMDIGVGYIADIQKYLLEARMDFLFGFNENQSSAFMTTVGAYYVLRNARNYTLFAGLEGGFGRVGTTEKTTYSSGGYSYTDDRDIHRSGFVGGADLGIELFPQSTVTADLRLRTLVLGDKMNDAVPVLTGLAVDVRF